MTYRAKKIPEECFLVTTHDPLDFSWNGRMELVTRQSVVQKAAYCREVNKFRKIRADRIDADEYKPRTLTVRKAVISEWEDVTTDYKMEE